MLAGFAFRLILDRNNPVPSHLTIRSKPSGNRTASVALRTLHFTTQCIYALVHSRLCLFSYRVL